LRPPTTTAASLTKPRAIWIELSPTTARPSAIPYRKRGEAYKAKGDLGRAIADYNKAIEIDPRDAIS